MPVIAIASNKGGAGKTTLAVNLASAFAEQGTTCLLDADPQQSACQWQNLSIIDQVITLVDASAGVAACLKTYQAQVDFLLIDCPPSIYSPQTKQAFAKSDLVLIPVLPSPFDLWASAKIDAELEQARKQNPDLTALLVINQLEPRTKLSQAMRRALAELDMPMAQTAVYRRMIYRSSILEGRTVFDEGVRGTEAADELRDLVQEVGALL